MFEPDMQTGS